MEFSGCTSMSEDGFDFKGKRWTSLFGFSQKKTKTIPHHQPRVEKAVQMEATANYLPKKKRTDLLEKSQSYFR